MDILLNYVVPVVHVILCLFLIAVVLLQAGKGADMGAVFGGGSSQTLFGSGGAGNFLTRLTTGMAIGFMLTSLILTYSTFRPSGSDLLDRLPATVPSAPAPGAQAPAPEPQAAAPENTVDVPAAPAPPAAEAPAGEPAPAK